MKAEQQPGTTSSRGAKAARSTTRRTSERRVKPATAEGRSVGSDTVDRPGSGSNRRAVEITLGELERMGRLERIDAARVQALRSMADALDHRPDSPQMWREYRNALEELIAADEGNDSEFIAALRGEVRDPEEN